MRCLIFISILVLISSAMNVSGQDPQLSQFYAAPQYLNPALAGSTFQDRIALNYRQQWAAAHKPYQTVAFGYDHNMTNNNGGYGLMVMNDQAGTHDLSFTMVALSFAYALKIDRKKSIRYGMRMAHVSRFYDPSKLLFADQVIRDDAPTSVESFLVERSSYMDFSAGAMYHTEDTWVGISFDHVSQPDQRLIETETTKLPIRTSVHAGRKFLISHARGLVSDHTYLTVSTVYKTQGKWDQFDVGGYISKESLSAGLWYRGLPGLKAYAPGYPNNDAIVAMVGFQTEEQLRIAYSYDLTISWLTPSSGGAHEISLVLEWPRQQKRRRYHMVPCPKF